MTWAEPRQLSLLPSPIDEQFTQFHHANPQVYEAIKTLAYQWKSAGHIKCSMKTLFEVLRWQYGITTRSTDGLLLNNSYTSRYTRLLQANERDLAGFFNTRSLEADRDTFAAIRIPAQEAHMKLLTEIEGGD